MHKQALRSIFSELVRQDRLLVVKELKLEEPKTKTMTKMLAPLNAKNVLFVMDFLDVNTYLASRNIPGVHVLLLEDLNPVDLVAHEKIIVSEATLKKIEERLQ